MASDLFASRKEFWGTMVVFAVLFGGIAFGVYQYHSRKQERKEIEQAGVLPRLTAEQEKAVETMVRQFGRDVLGVTPEQEKAIEAVWWPRPRTLDDVVAAKNKTDALLTPQQRAMVKPFQSMMRNSVVDRIVEPARNYFPEQDFQKFKAEIKKRAAQRVGN